MQIKTVRFKPVFCRSVMRGGGAGTAPRGPLLSDHRAEVMTFPSEVIKGEPLLTFNPLMSAHANGHAGPPLRPGL